MRCNGLELVAAAPPESRPGSFCARPASVPCSPSVRPVLAPARSVLAPDRSPSFRPAIPATCVTGRAGGHVPAASAVSAGGGDRSDAHVTVRWPPADVERSPGERRRGPPTGRSRDRPPQRSRGVHLTVSGERSARSGATRPWQRSRCVHLSSFHARTSGLVVGPVRFSARVGPDDARASARTMAGLGADGRRGPSPSAPPAWAMAEGAPPRLREPARPRFCP
jgi:hypothetical protein